MRDDGEEQQHAGEDREGEEGGDVIGRAEIGRLGGKCDEGDEGEGKSVEGGKWRRSGGGGEKEEQEALTLDLTVTSPGEQPSPNPGGIFDTIQIFIKKSLPDQQIKVDLLAKINIVKISAEIFRKNIFKNI